MKRFWVWLAMVSIAGGWEVSFDSHPDNVGVVMVVDCVTQPYFALNRREVTGTMTRVWFPEPRGLPADAGCQATVMMMRNDTPDQPDRETIAETITQPLD